MLLVTALGFGLFSVLSGLAVGLVSFSVARFFVGRASASPRWRCRSTLRRCRRRGFAVRWFHSINSPSPWASVWLTSLITPLPLRESWRWMFASAVFPALVLLIGMIFLPESPRWLARKGFRDQALENFRRLGRGDEAETELAEVEGALARGAGGVWHFASAGISRGGTW